MVLTANQYKIVHYEIEDGREHNNRTSGTIFHKEHHVVCRKRPLGEKSATGPYLLIPYQNTQECKKIINNPEGCLIRRYTRGNAALGI